MKFIGRKKELEDLNRLQKKKSASIAVIRGRRRIGKSRLIQEFTEDKKNWIFSGLPPIQGITKQRQLDVFAMQMAKNTNTAIISRTTAPSLSGENSPVRAMTTKIRKHKVRMLVCTALPSHAFFVMSVITSGNNRMPTATTGTTKYEKNITILFRFVD